MAHEGAPRAPWALVRAGRHRSTATRESKVVVDTEVRGHYYSVELSG